MKKKKKNDQMESKMSFKEVLEKNFPPRKTEKTKYLISKSKIKSGFSSDKFIIFGEDKREFDRYRNLMIDRGRCLCHMRMLSKEYSVAMRLEKKFNKNNFLKNFLLFNAKL